MLLLIVMITSLCKQYKSVQTIHNAQITKGSFYMDKIVVCVFLRDHKSVVFSS